MSDVPPPVKPTNAQLEAAAAKTHAECHNKRPVTASRVLELNKLHSHLANNARLYETCVIQDQRDAVADSLLAVSDFLQTQGFALTTIAHLHRPVAALVEREKNSLDLMFAERERVGRSGLTLTDHERTGILAELANLWLRIHAEDPETQDQKLSMAARAMKGRWFKNGVTRSRLKKAREVVSQEMQTHPAVVASQGQRETIEQVIAQFGLLHSFAITIRMINDVQLPFGGGEGGILKTRPIPGID